LATTLVVVTTLALVILIALALLPALALLAALLLLAPLTGLLFGHLINSISEGPVTILDLSTASSAKSFRTGLPAGRQERVNPLTRRP